MSTRYYVGAPYTGKSLRIFTCKHTPTEVSHGETYRYVVGPFSSKLAAEIFAKHGVNNPHFQHTSDANRYAKMGRVKLRSLGFNV